MLVSGNFSPKEGNKLVRASPSPPRIAPLFLGSKKPGKSLFVPLRWPSIALLGTQSDTKHPNPSGFLRRVVVPTPPPAWRIAERLKGLKIVQSQHGSLAGIEMIFSLPWASRCQRRAFEPSSAGRHRSPELSKAWGGGGPLGRILPARARGEPGSACQSTDATAEPPRCCKSCLGSS